MDGQREFAYFYAGTSKYSLALVDTHGGRYFKLVPPQLGLTNDAIDAVEFDRLTFLCYRPTPYIILDVDGAYHSTVGFIQGDLIIQCRIRSFLHGISNTGNEAITLEFIASLKTLTTSPSLHCSFRVYTKFYTTRAATFFIHDLGTATSEIRYNIWAGEKVPFEAAGSIIGAISWATKGVIPYYYLKLRFISALIDEKKFLCLHLTREGTVNRDSAFRSQIHARFEVPIKRTQRLLVTQTQPPGWHQRNVDREKSVWLLGICWLKGTTAERLTPIEDGEISANEDTNHSIFGALNSIFVQPYLGAVTSIRADRPFSFLPTLYFEETADNQLESCAVFRAADLDPGGEAASAHLTDLRLIHLAVGHLETHLGSSDRFEVEDVTCLATFLGVKTHSNDVKSRVKRTLLLQQQQMNLDLLVDAFRDNPEKIGDASLPLLSMKLIDKGKSGESEAVRLGSFDINFADQEYGKQQDEDILNVWLDSSKCTMFVDICLHLRLANFSPASQDPSELEQTHADRRRGNFVLIPVDGSTAHVVDAPKTLGRNDLYVKIKEKDSALTYKRQNIDLVIYSENSGDSKHAGSQDIVVFDTMPFFITKVHFPNLQPSSDNNVLAMFSTDSVEGAVWTITAAREGYDLLLPPQGIAESQPKLPSVDGRQPELVPPNANNQFADFRFSPPARLTLFTTFRGSKRAAVEPPTNTRRIFGDASQRAPGAPLREGKFELLYGMPATVARDDLLVTELTAELGLLPRLLTADEPPWEIEPKNSVRDEYVDFKKGWEHVHRAFDRRLGVLTLRQLNRLNVGQDAPDEAPKLAEGVTFELRPEAKIRQPMPLPKNGEGTPYAQGKPRANFRETGGVAGGSDWGFESSEVYKALWRDPKSDSGELADVHFSALGGWGYQKAAFNNRRTSIISRTGMGRTHFYSIERVGRIAGLWNRCKHVIVYQRTVERGRQFPGQAELSRRPFLRKVREFIEVLQPERRYPDLTEEPIRNGPLLACRFRTTIIPVDSAWGQEILNQGWKVPLWRPEAAGVPPQVELVLACDETSGAGSTRYEIAKPEQLWFFTNTRDGYDDRTDLWPPVPDVDFGKRPLPKPVTVASYAASDPDQRLPSAAPVESGFEPFTLDIRPIGEQPVNVMAQRADRAVGVVLHNLTLVRATSASLEGDARLAAEEARSALALKERVEEQIGRLRVELGKLDGTTLTEAAAVRLKAEVDGIKDAVGKISGELNTLLIKHGNELGKINPCDELKKSASEAIGAARKRFEKELDEALVQLRGDLAEELQGDQAALHRLVDPWFVRVRFLISQLGNALLPLKAPLEGLAAFDPMTLITTQLDRGTRELTTASGRGAASLIAALDRFTAGLLASIDGNLDRLGAELSRKMPNAKKTIDEARTDFRGRLAQELDAAVRDAKKTIHTEPQQASKAIEHLSLSVKKLFEDGTDLRKLLDALKNQSKNFSSKVTVNIETIKSVIDEKLTYPITGIENTVNDIIKDRTPDERINAINDETRKCLNLLNNNVFISLNQAVNGSVDTLCEDLLGSDKVFKTLLEGLNFKSKLDSLNGLLRAGQPIANVLSTIDGGLQEQVENLRTGVDGLVDAIGTNIESFGQIPAAGLALVRALGEAPRVPGLDFNRDQIAYYFDAAKRVVDVTPVTALIERSGQDLKAFGMRLPTLSLGDGVIPNLPDLQNFDLGKIFPDFAGVRLDGLFKDFKLPNLDTGRLKVRHGLDPQTRRGWLEARVDTLPLGRRASVFDLGPVGLALEDGRFDASARVEAGEGSAFAHRAVGEIRGDWVMAFGGQTLVRFRDTPLKFDDTGKLAFDLRPEKVQLEETIKFLERFVTALGDEEGGLKTTLVKDGGLPVGVDCLLDLPVPPLTYGAFGISGLRFTTGVQLRAYPEFVIATRLALGSQAEPFTLTVFILGGAGWLEAKALYKPLSGALETDLSLAIGASALLGINLRFITGVVQIFLGINAELHTQSSSAARTTIRLVLLVRGSVVVIGVLRVCLELLLVGEIRDGQVTGRGTARFTVKLGFLKRSVSQDVEMKLAGNKTRASLVDDAAQPWLATLI